jgi:hypothetical protein
VYLVIQSSSTQSTAGKRDAEAWMESMELVGERAEVQRKADQEVGHVAAAKAAAVGTEDADVQRRAQHAGEQQLDGRAQQGAGAETPARPAAAPAAPAAELNAEQQAAGNEDVQQHAMEAAARQQDAGASQEEQEAAAKRALEEAEEQEGEGGNVWAKALGAAGVAASATAVAAAVTQGLAL